MLTKFTPVLIIHGGAWEIPDEEIQAHLDGIRSALHVGWGLLGRGNHALDAVEETVAAMEDDATFGPEYRRFC